MGHAKSPIIKSWARHFANLNHQVHLITSESDPVEDLSVEGTTLHRIGSERSLRVINFARKAIQTKSQLKEIKPDIVHVHYVFGYGLLVALAGFHPFVTTAMGNDIGISPEISLVCKWGVKYTMKRADAVAVKDRFAKARAIKLGCPEEKIVIAHSNCDTSRFSPEARSEELRKKLGISDKPSILFTRMINKEYQADVLFKAIPIVAKKIPDIRFMAIQKGLDWQKWKEYLIDNGAAENVLFLPEIPHEEMCDYLASIDAYVDTYYPAYDVGGHGHGTNTVEAMSCSCPQILPDRVEYTESWCHALLYPKGDPEGLARAIIELFSDEEIRKALGKKSRESALEFGDEDKVMGEMFKLYQRLIDK